MSEIESVLNLLIDLRGQADICRNDDAEDVARLLDKAAQEIERLHQIELAAKNLCCVKGGRHSEQAMQRLMDACGFNGHNNQVHRASIEDAKSGGT